MLPTQAFAEVRLQATSIGGSTPLGRVRHIENAPVEWNGNPCSCCSGTLRRRVLGIGAVVSVIGYRVFWQQGKEWVRVNANSPPNCHPGAQPSFCGSDAIMADNGAMLRSDIRRFPHFDDLPGHVMSISTSHDDGSPDEWLCTMQSCVTGANFRAGGESRTRKYDSSLGWQRASLIRSNVFRTPT